VTVEHGDDIILAEMVADLDAAILRADEVRDALLPTGLTPSTAE
jgi:hypothetical protein